jgi:hypothetical protein
VSDTAILGCVRFASVMTSIASPLSKFFDGFGWQNVVCLLIGIGVVAVGYSGNEFKGHLTREPISTSKGKLISYITGAVFILFGVFAWHWR